jgi:NAD(P)-dependent dehydrogenase (short-subunit alcohol dehydrogenase family)
VQHSPSSNHGIVETSTLPVARDAAWMTFMPRPRPSRSGVAVGLAAAGWRVCLTDVVADELAATAADAATAAGAPGAVLSVEADVSDLSAMDNVMGKVVAAWGRLDLVVANAGILDARNIADMDAVHPCPPLPPSAPHPATSAHDAAPAGPAWRRPPASTPPPVHGAVQAGWSRTIAINLTGVWHTFKAAWPHLLAQARLDLRGPSVCGEGRVCGRAGRPACCDARRLACST